jgi:hypothetical protein
MGLIAAFKMKLSDLATLITADFQTTELSPFSSLNAVAEMTLRSGLAKDLSRHHESGFAFSVVGWLQRE